MSEFFITGVGPYRMRNGDRAKVTGSTDHMVYAWRGVVDGAERTWTSGGSYRRDRESGLDIVAKWTDPEPPKPVEVEVTDLDRKLAAAKPHEAIEVTQAELGELRVWQGSPAKRKSVLDAAAAAVADRGLNYGSPEDNFGRIARLWSTHLQNRSWAVVTSTDVAIMLALVKIARLENDPTHADSWVDIAGYAACGAEVSDAKLL